MSGISSSYRVGRPMSVTLLPRRKYSSGCERSCSTTQSVFSPRTGHGHHSWNLPVSLAELSTHILKARSAQSFTKWNLHVP
jgi:hypothetical protein